MTSWIDAAADEIDPDKRHHKHVHAGYLAPLDYNAPGTGNDIDFGFTDPKSWREYVELITPVLDEAAEALAKYHAENRKIRTRLRRAYRALWGRP